MGFPPIPHLLEQSTVPGRLWLLVGKLPHELAGIGGILARLYTDEATLAEILRRPA